MIPRLAVVLRCKSATDQARLSKLLGENEEGPPLPLYRALLASKLALTRPTWDQSVPLPEEEVPPQPTVAYIDAAGSSRGTPYAWASAEGLLRWAACVVIFGASQQRDYFFEKAVEAAPREHRLLIVRTPDDSRTDWETSARLWAPHRSVTLHPEPLVITPDGLEPTGDFLAGLESGPAKKPGPSS
jgi:hypothetical protein